MSVEPSVETKINKILQDYLSEIINACRGNKINPSKKAVKAIESLLIGEDKCRNCGATEYREEVKRQVQAQMREEIKGIPNRTILTDEEWDECILKSDVLALFDRGE
jgi:hypothetical protein